MASTGKSAREIVEHKGLVQISDSSAIEQIILDVISNNPKEVAAYKGGKSKLLGFFVGQVMQATGGQANPQMVNAILKEKLGQ